MDEKWSTCSGELLSGSHSEGLVFPYPLPKALKDSRRNLQGLLTLSKIQDKELAQSEDLLYLLEELRADVVAGAETVWTSSVEDLQHCQAAELLCPSPRWSVRIRDLLIPAAKDTEPRTCQRNTLATLPARNLSFTVNQNLPSENRTNDPLPPVVAALKGLDLGDGETSFDSGSLWGQASLVSADGRVPMARVVPDILSGSIVAPLLRNNSDWSLVFDDLVIRQPGYYKIYIALIQTSRREGRGDGESIIEAPQEVLGAVTSMIYVHAFAAVPGRIGEEDPL